MKSASDPYWLRLLPLFLRQRLSGRNNLFAVLHNSGWLIFDKIMRGLLTLLVGAWVARYLGPQQFGALAYALAYLTLFQAVAFLGLDGVVVRDIARIQHSTHTPTLKANKIGVLLGTVFALRLIAGMTCWLLAVGGMWYFSTSQNALLVALAGGSLIFQAADSVDLWFQSQSQSRRTVIAKLIAYLLSNGLRVVFILEDLPLVWFAAALCIEFSFAAVALFFSYKWFSCGAKWVINFLEVGRSLVAESYLFALGGLFNLLSNKIDQIIVRQYLGDSALGLYSVFLPIIAICYAIPNMVCVSAMPYFAMLHKENPLKFRKKLAQFFSINYLLSFILVGVIFIFADEIIVNIFGRQYVGSKAPFMIYSLTAVTTTSWITQWLWTYNQQKGGQQLWQTLFGAALTTLLSLALVPVFGISGAAISIVASQFLAFIVFNFFFDKELFYLQFCIVKG